MAEAEETKQEAEKPKSKMLLIIIIAVLSVLLVGGGVTAFFMLSGSKDKTAQNEAPKATPAIYFDFKPPFIVNYQVKGRQRFVQISISVLTRKSSVVDVLKKQMPLLRNNLLMTLSSQDFESLRTPEGKEALRQAMLDQIQKVVSQSTGEPGVEQVLFTNFVMQ